MMFKLTDEMAQSMPIGNVYYELQRRGFNMRRPMTSYHSDQEMCIVFMQEQEERDIYRRSNIGIDFAVGPDRCIIQKPSEQLKMEKERQLAVDKMSLKQSIKKQLDQQKQPEPDLTLVDAQQQLTGKEQDDK